MLGHCVGCYTRRQHSVTSYFENSAVNSMRWMLVGVPALLLGCVGEVGNGIGQGSGGGGLAIGDACTDRFSASEAAAGADCTPVYNRYCPPLGTTSPSNQTEVPFCSGVEVSRGTATVDGLSSGYVVLTPVTGGRSGLYVALHWVGGNAETMIGRMRLSELARGRDLTVVAPTAPGTPATWGFDTLPSLTELTTRIQLLDAVIAQARERTGLQSRVYMSGLSGGGVMAFEYACQRADQVLATELVAAEVQPATLSGCVPSQPFVNVQVHGTLDYVAPYNAVPLRSAGVVNIFEDALDQNGCDAGRVSTANLPSLDMFVTGIEVRFAPPSVCSSGIGASLVTVQGGGHNWPGYDDPLGLGLGINGYGPTSNGFDATLQGYDLMRELSR